MLDSSPLFKLAVVGSRGFSNWELLCFVLEEYCMTNPNLCIVSGGCPKGADYLAEEYAKMFELERDIYPADWDAFGKSAGYIRNTLIVQNCDEVVAFWDGKSKGTKHTIDIARKQGKTVVVIEYGNFNGFGEDWDNSR